MVPFVFFRLLSSPLFTCIALSVLLSLISDFHAPLCPCLVVQSAQCYIVTSWVRRSSPVSLWTTFTIGVQYLLVTCLMLIYNLWISFTIHSLSVTMWVVGGLELSFRPRQAGSWAVSPLPEGLFLDAGGVALTITKNSSLL